MLSACASFKFCTPWCSQQPGSHDVNLGVSDRKRHSQRRRLGSRPRHHNAQLITAKRSGTLGDAAGKVVLGLDAANCDALARCNTSEWSAGDV